MSGKPSLLIFDELNISPDLIDHPDFIKKRILIISYIHLGYDCAYIAKVLEISEENCLHIINVFTKYGFKAILKRDFGLTRKKVQKKLNSDEIFLIKKIVRSKPPVGLNKWTYNAITNIINNSGWFTRKISLGTLRLIILSQNIDMDEWKSNPIDSSDPKNKNILHLINGYEQIETKSIKEFDLDVEAVQSIISDLVVKSKTITLMNVFIKYKEIYNLPKLTIYIFSKLLKNNLPNWKQLKEQSPKQYYTLDKSIKLNNQEKKELMATSESKSTDDFTRLRAKICIEFEQGFYPVKISEKLGCSVSMIYTTYKRYKQHGIKSIVNGPQNSNSIKKEGKYIPISIKKYPDLISEIKNIVSTTPPGKKQNWTIAKITQTLHDKKYEISTTSIAKLIQYHNIDY